MRPIRSTEPASDEFGEAVRWYEARRSGLGGEFFDASARLSRVSKATRTLARRFRLTAKPVVRW
jgi:hypothetical protein